MSNSKEPKLTPQKLLTGLAPLEGMLAHIDLVRRRSELAQKTRPDTKEERGFRKLYADFLFYKNFISPTKPLLLPEGKTDPIYLRAAVEHLPQFHPQLGALSGGKFMSAIRFMSYGETLHRVLKLGASTGYFVPFVAQYHNRAKVFRHKPMAFPVIILVDNDEGGKQVFAAANKFASSPITLSSSSPFYYLGLNLYLVKTPEPGGNQHSRIEDLFPAPLLETKLNGKSFDPDKLHEEGGKYGKFKFAEQVVRRNAATIDFSGFVPLLDRIASALTDYKARLASIAAAAAE
jgi:RNA-directed DNA polymerase